MGRGRGETIPSFPSQVRLLALAMMPGKHPPSGQRIRRRIEKHRYVYRDIDTGGKKSQKAWKLSRRAGARQGAIRRAKAALEKAARMPKPKRKGGGKRREEDQFEPQVVEVNAITYEEGA